MSTTRFLGMAAILLASTLVACTPMQTFPPTVGKATFDPAFSPTPELFRLGVVTGHKQSSVADQPIVFNLPPGVREQTWDKVTAMIGNGARPAKEGDRDVVGIEEVRLNGGQAEIDVVVPKGEIYQLYTLHLTGGGLGGWRVNYVQPWSLRTAAPMPNQPAAMAAAAAAKAENDATYP